MSRSIYLSHRKDGAKTQWHRKVLLPISCSMIRRPSFFINPTVSYYLIIGISRHSSHSSSQFDVSTNLVAAVGMNSSMRCGTAIRTLSLALNITMYTPSSPKSFTPESAVMFYWPMIFREPFPTTPALKADDALVSTAIRRRLSSTKRLLFRFFQRSRKPLRSVL